jgi:hypothetical protein
MSYWSYSEETYRGWAIRKVSDYYYGPGSVTPTYYYIASRHGVSMNTNSLEGIKRMVDTRYWLMATQKKCSWSEE